MLIGGGNGLSSGVNLTLGADLAPPRCRGEFIGLYRLITNAGSFLGPVVVGAVVIRTSTSAAAWGLAVTGVATAVWMACMIQETLKKKGSAEGQRPEGSLAIAAFVPLEDTGHHPLEEPSEEGGSADDASLSPHASLAATCDTTRPENAVT